MKYICRFAVTHVGLEEIEVKASTPEEAERIAAQLIIKRAQVPTDYNVVVLPIKIVDGKLVQEIHKVRAV